MSPLGGMLSNMIGRRKCFVVFAVIGILGYVTMALSPNIPALFVGRFLTVMSSSGVSAIIGKLECQLSLVRLSLSYNW